LRGRRGFLPRDRATIEFRAFLRCVEEPTERLVRCVNVLTDR
jgi:hypothetical protein